jgi:TonB family protein
MSAMSQEESMIMAVRIDARGAFPALSAFLSSMLFVAAMSLSAQEQGTVKGTVADSAGVPIFSAEIALEGSSIRVFSDERGEFRLMSVPLGARVLKARRLGFTPSQVNVEVAEAAGASVSIRMKPVAAPLPPVVIRASKMNFTGRLSGYYERLAKRSSGYFITREQIDRENPSTLGQLLQRTPGISAVRGRGGSTGVRMRGRRCGPLVWIDGTPMPAGEVDIDSFAPSTLHGIELYLGATTAPLRFIFNRDRSSCGTILLWSRGPDTDPIISTPTPSVDLEELVARLAVYNADQVDQRAHLDTSQRLLLSFPPPLYAARVGGLVIAEFVVDTAGRMEKGTLGIVSSTAPLFTEAVRVALETANYVPAVKGGRHVRQLIQQPFRFDVGGETGTR